MSLVCSSERSGKRLADRSCDETSDVWKCLFTLTVDHYWRGSTSEPPGWSIEGRGSGDAEVKRRVETVSGTLAGV